MSAKPNGPIAAPAVGTSLGGSAARRPPAPRGLRIGAALLGIAALALFPVAVDNPYYLHLLETILIYAILLFGLDIVVGYTGQVSLGHAGLFGIGAYTAGVLVTKLGTPLLVTLVGAIGIT